MELIWTNVFSLDIIGMGHLFLLFPIHRVPPHTTNGVLDNRFVYVFTRAKKNKAKPALNRCLVHQLTKQYLPHLITTVEGGELKQ
jgi:hypothetical protein